MLSEEVKLICKEVKIDLAFVCFLFDFWQGQRDSNPIDTRFWRPVLYQLSYTPI